MKKKRKEDINDKWVVIVVFQNYILDSEALKLPLFFK
jgi:hypothetical protein